MAAAVVLMCASLSSPVMAKEQAPFEASKGLDIARAAALVWSHDAALIYVENDETVDTGGGAMRWGYLFYSQLLRKARAYSVREGRIVVAEDLELKLEAPPVMDSWIDSGAALKAADENAGGAFRRDHGGQLNTMVLMRGAFAEGDPDRTTWMLVYTSPGAPALFVVVDAADGTVRRTWRG
jgi:hypothetical protein